HSSGEMAEWFNAPVLKTGEPQGSGGSNPSLSATDIVTAFTGLRRAILYLNVRRGGAPLQNEFSV
ncbi:MAG: hypothetical protein PWQ29_1222, partial [Verrucomicrobiota bacterium]|nr:hypothetical protein [Verrucomicrobiota bacterium]